MTTWKHLNRKHPEKLCNTADQFIWYNENIRVNGKTQFDPVLFGLGFWYIRDFLDRGGNTLTFGRMYEHIVPKNKFMMWNALLHAIPKDWKQAYKTAPPNCDREFISGIYLQNNINDNKGINIEAIKNKIVIPTTTIG
jgi:hypothetical protein